MIARYAYGVSKPRVKEGKLKVIRIICVDCGFGRPPLASSECPRCESNISVPAKVTK
jgi:predicted Zn-ribbon and HTH transcriptional regulator